MKFPGIVALLISLGSLQLFAGKDPFSEGVKAHGEKNYTLAAQKFTEAISSESNNSSAYYNLGMAEMGNGHFGAATWAFEKVLKFDPNDGEALAKLERCQEELDPGMPYSPVLNSIESTLYGISSDIWAILAILCSLTFGLCLVFFKIKKHPSLRRVFLITGFFSLLAIGFCTYTASATYTYFGTEKFGIVVQPKISTYLDDENPDNTELKEGTRLILLDENKGLLVKVKDLTGHEYLVKRSDLRYF